MATVTSRSLGEVLYGDDTDNSLSGGDGDDTIYGYDGADALSGGEGNDWILGGNGDDLLGGGDGDDHLDAGSSDDRDVVHGGEGNDTLGGLSAGDQVFGGAGNDIIEFYYGASGADPSTIDGGSGFDTLRAFSTELTPSTISGVERLEARFVTLDVDQLGSFANIGALSKISPGLVGLTLDGDGGTGDLSGKIDAGVTNFEVINQAGGLTTLTLSDSWTSRFVFLDMAGSNNIVRGGGGHDTIYGYAGADRLIGGAGHDILDGGAHDDVLEGGRGNDTYVVDGNDRIVEWSNGGTDLVRSSVTFSLSGKQVENLTLLGAANINGLGSIGDNLLIGNAGNNVLDGRAGADHMEAGPGNDTYIVDHVGDQVIEQRNQGTDLIKSSIDFDLNGTNVENLWLLGTADIDAVGSDVNNSLKGNDGDNALSGGGGGDWLAGGAGDDQLSGGAGSDRFIIKTNGGTDTILDFQDKSDRIDLQDVAGVDGFDDLQLVDLGASVQIGYGSGAIVLGNISSLARIDAKDFIF